MGVDDMMGGGSYRAEKGRMGGKGARERASGKGEREGTGRGSRKRTCSLDGWTLTGMAESRWTTAGRPGEDEAGSLRSRRTQERQRRAKAVRHVTLSQVTCDACLAEQARAQYCNQLRSNYTE